MAVRNFWVEANIDGRETTLGGGPRAKEGEMTVNFYQREEGSIVSDVVKVICRVNDGILTTEVYNKEGVLVYSYKTAM